MFSFMIKKTFFDWWDNFFFFFLLNIGYILVLVLLFSISSPFSDSLLVSSLVFFLKIELFSVYTGVIAQVTREISDYRSVGWDDFFQYFKSSYKTSLFLGAFLFCFFPTHYSAQFLLSTDPILLGNDSIVDLFLDHAGHSFDFPMVFPP